MRVRVKICGITRPVDGQAAAQAGADAIGLVFYERSPRAVNLAQAGAVIDSLPPFIAKVGLFVNAEAATVRDALARLPLDLLQFHGEETADYCESFRHPYIKAVRMRGDLDIEDTMRRYPRAVGFLLDAYHPELPGGSGETFDWARVPAGTHRPIILAGGLTPDNVAAAIQATRPYAVDVSSGVEQDKGIKDAAKIVAFIRGVNRVNTE